MDYPQGPRNYHHYYHGVKSGAADGFGFVVVAAALIGLVVGYPVYSKSIATHAPNNTVLTTLFTGWGNDNKCHPDHPDNVHLTGSQKSHLYNNIIGADAQQRCADLVSQWSQ